MWVDKTSESQILLNENFRARVGLGIIGQGGPQGLKNNPGPSHAVGCPPEQDGK